MPDLVLASSSPFRRSLLAKLGLPFSCRTPDTDETPLPGESAQALVMRLAEHKALAARRADVDELIIGSDQVALLGETILGKPQDHANATAQLRLCRGQTVTFLTGLCLLNSGNGRTQVVIEPFEVHFRDLTDAQIERYLRTEQPYQCAGSFKSEGLGIALFRRLQGNDPNALVGLPLIRLIELLGNEGITLP